jgi:hypothetical protein
VLENMRLEKIVISIHSKTLIMKKRIRQKRREDYNSRATKDEYLQS